MENDGKTAQTPEQKSQEGAVGQETAAQTEDAQQENEKPVKNEKTYTRDEVNKIIHAEVQKALGTFQAQQDEAQKLSRMQEDERMRYEKEQAEKRAREATAQLNAYRLREEARKLADKEGLPSTFLDCLDFSKMTAEQLVERVPQLSKTFSESVEQELSKRLRQASPKTHTPGGEGTNYDALLQQARENNDMTAIAYYTRMKAQNRS